MHQISQEKAQMLRHYSKLWWLNVKMLRVVPGEELSRAPLAARGALPL